MTPGYKGGPRYQLEGTAVHTYNPSNQEAGQGYEFEASLDYQVGGREGESGGDILGPPLFSLTWAHSFL